MIPVTSGHVERFLNPVKKFLKDFQKVAITVTNLPEPFEREILIHGKIVQFSTFLIIAFDVHIEKKHLTQIEVKIV